MHILPLSYEGSAMWGPDHGYLDNGDNPLTSLRGTDGADLHSAIKTNPNEPMCHHPRQQGLQAAQQTIPPNCSPRSSSPPTPTHPPSAEGLLPKPLQAFSWQRTDLLPNLWQIYTGGQQETSPVGAGPQILTDLSDTADIVLVRLQHTAVKHTVYTAGCSICI